MTEKSLATAADVRTWLVAHPKTLAKLSPSAQATVIRTDGGLLRGRLAVEAFTAYNKGQRKGEYVLGATKATVTAQRKAAAKVRKVASQRAARKGLTIGQRGPLPAAFKPQG